MNATQPFHQRFLGALAVLLLTVAVGCGGDGGGDVPEDTVPSRPARAISSGYSHSLNSLSTMAASWSRFPPDEVQHLDEVGADPE
jgi:hypothetical protein